jgi:hypothetical protein
MTDVSPSLLPRRRFLRGAAGIVGAIPLGLSVGPGTRPARAAGRNTAVSLYFWDGSRLVDASDLPEGDPSLRGTAVRVALSRPAAALGVVRRLRAVNAHFPTADGRLIPFYAWSADQDRPGVTFVVAVDEARGLILSIERERRETFLRLNVGDIAGTPKLKAGTYILTSGTPNLFGCRCEMVQEGTRTSTVLTRRTRRGFVPVALDYLVITVTPA